MWNSLTNTLTITHKRRALLLLVFYSLWYGTFSATRLHSVNDRVTSEWWWIHEGNIHALSGIRTHSLFCCCCCHHDIVGVKHNTCPTGVNIPQELHTQLFATPNTGSLEFKIHLPVYTLKILEKTNNLNVHLYVPWRWKTLHISRVRLCVIQG